MIADDIRNLELYPQFDFCREQIFGFIDKVKKEGLPDGRYPLIGEDTVFALLQSYETKPKDECRMESHFRYADLQYILEGEEIIGYERTEVLEPEDEPSPGDIRFYKKGRDTGGNLLTAGMFGYYAPTDAHMPCISAKEGLREKARKIVFKIQV